MKQGDVVFTASDREYEGYDDFWRLVSLSGFRRVTLVEVDLGSPVTYICPTFDVEFMKLSSSIPRGKRAARVVFWYLERPDAHISPGMDPLDTFRRSNDEILGMADEVWVSDRGLHRADPRTRFVVLGGHPDLCVPQGMNPHRSGLMHIGQMSLRRQEIVREIKSRGISVYEGGWGWSRNFCASLANALLSVDRIGTLKVATPLRWAVAAAYRLPILCEEVEDPRPLVPGQSILMAPYQGLPDLVMESLGRPDIQKFGQQAWDAYCYLWTFRRGVEEALGGKDGD